MVPLHASEHNVLYSTPVFTLHQTLLHISYIGICCYWYSFKLRWSAVSVLWTVDPLTFGENWAVYSAQLKNQVLLLAYLLQQRTSHRLSVHINKIHKYLYGVHATLMNSHTTTVTC